MKNFAIIGAAGFVAPRHLKAIHDTGNRLVAAVDPHDSVGVLDRYFPDVRFFTEIERFDRFLEKLRRGGEDERAHYVSDLLAELPARRARPAGAAACTPTRSARSRWSINPWNLDALAELETGVRPARLHGAAAAPAPGAAGAARARRSGTAAAPGRKHDVVLTYVTRRGPWYFVSWKGSSEKSGGVAMNIGIHFFDLLLWLFGRVESQRGAPARSRARMAGRLELERAQRALVPLGGRGRTCRRVTWRPGARPSAR